MVGSRKLSNDEVEALLGGLETDEEQAVATHFDPNEVREFKFGSEDLSLLGGARPDHAHGARIGSGGEYSRGRQEQPPLQTSCV